MRHFISIFIATALAIAPSTLAEPVTVSPGDGTVDGSFIVAYENAWTMTRRDADGTETAAGRWTDMVEIIDNDGRKAIRRTQQIFTPDGPLQYTVVNIVDHESLVPISATMTTPLGFMHADKFDGAKVVGSIRMSKDAEEQTYEHKMERAAFDWSIYGTLLIGFPLDVGYEARFPTFVINAGSSDVTIDWVEFEVQESEHVKAGAKGHVETSIVQVTHGDDSFTFYLTRDAPYIIKLAYKQADGTVTTWEME